MEVRLLINKFKGIMNTLWFSQFSEILWALHLTIIKTMKTLLFGIKPCKKLTLARKPRQQICTTQQVRYWPIKCFLRTKYFGSFDSGYFKNNERPKPLKICSKIVYKKMLFNHKGIIGKNHESVSFPRVWMSAGNTYCC